MSLPKTIQKYFWGDDLNQLSWDQHQNYITQTILEKGDREAVRWLFDKCGKAQLAKQLPSMKLSPRSSNFWKVYLV